MFHCTCFLTLRDLYVTITKSSVSIKAIEIHSSFLWSFDLDSNLTYPIQRTSFDLTKLFLHFFLQLDESGSNLSKCSAQRRKKFDTATW